MKSIIIYVEVKIKLMRNIILVIKMIFNFFLFSWEVLELFFEFKYLGL